MCARHCTGCFSYSLSWAFQNKSVTQNLQFSSVASYSLQPHEPQHARPPCPSPTPRVHPNPCPLSRWCHPTISSCHPLLLLPSIFPSIRVFSNESAVRIRWPKYWSWFHFTFREIEAHRGEGTHPRPLIYILSCLIWSPSFFKPSLIRAFSTVICTIRPCSNGSKF